MIWSIGIAWHVNEDIVETLNNLLTNDSIAEIIISASDKPAAEVDKVFNNKRIRLLSKSTSSIYEAWHDIAKDCRGTHLSFLGIGDKILVNPKSQVNLNELAIGSVQLVTTSSCIEYNYFDRVTRGKYELGRLKSPVTPEILYPTLLLRKIDWNLIKQFKIGGDVLLFQLCLKSAENISSSELVVSMIDGGRSTYSSYLLTVFRENIKIMRILGENIPLLEMFKTLVIIFVRYFLYRIAGNNGDKIWNSLRQVGGKPSRY